MTDNNERKDVILIAKCVSISIAIGLLAVIAYLLSKQVGDLSAFIWSLAFLMCGTGIGFLFGIPRILTNDVIPELPADGTGTNPVAKSRTGYRPSSHLERISDWLTTLIVGLTLVQWDYVSASFTSISHYIATGLNPAKPEIHVSFVSAIMLYFSVNGFLGSYLLTRTYLARIFERFDVGSPLADAERRELNQADLSNPMNVNLESTLGSAARKIVDYSLNQLGSLDDVIAWSKAQFAAGNYENAIEGYKKATEMVPNDVQLILEYTNALYLAGTKSADSLRIIDYRDQSRRLLNRAYSLLTQTSNPELKMKVYRAITYFYLFSNLDAKDFENAIRFGEEFVADRDPRKIRSMGILVNLACAYAQQFSWLDKNQGTETEKETARKKALEYVTKVVESDIDGRWKIRLQTLLRSDVPKDRDDDDLEIFEKDKEFRSALDLPEV